MEKIKFLEEADLYSETRKQLKNNAMDPALKAEI